MRFERIDNTIVSTSRGPGKAFTIFALVMAAVMVLGTVVVFGGTMFGESDDTAEPTIAPQDEEVRELETRVAENPDNADDAALLANIYANEGRVEDAIPLFERAIDQDPDDGGLRLAFGIALFRAGNEFDARVQLERAYELESDKSGPAYYLGQLEENRREPDLDAAREWYEEAIEANPESLVAEQAEERLEELESGDEDIETPTE